ncbi:MAG: methylamine utilization protein [Gammaproteobacteria bacterium]|nr:methylamine utilization protein [Gammaproteobacteria bacterium]
MRANYLVGVFGALLITNALAAEYEITQKDRTFSVVRLQIKVGDTVSFKNDDPYFHNVYSLSDTKTFDLGSYSQGQSKKVVFDQPGTVEIECAIHPYMKLTVQVDK